MANKILVFAEQRDGAFRKSSFEAIGRAKQLASEVHVLVVGDGVAALAGSLGAYGADHVHVVEGETLKLYHAEGYAAALSAAVEAVSPDAVFMIASAMGKDLAPRVAARQRMAFLSNCISIEENGDAFQALKSMYGGKVFATVKAVKSPVMVTLRPSSYPVPETSGGEAVSAVLAVELPSDGRAKVVEVAKKEEGMLDVQEAEIVVSGGRGLKEPDNFKIIQGLAEALGGAVGASRAAVDAGWIDHAHQVGQTGKTVSPKLYVAVGISGAIQHLAGMRTSKCIVAINKDSDAPIFNMADYGIVGDLFKVVPALTEAVKKAKE